MATPSICVVGWSTPFTFDAHTLLFAGHSPRVAAAKAVRSVSHVRTNPYLRYLTVGAHTEKALLTASGNVGARTWRMQFKRMQCSSMQCSPARIVVQKSVFEPFARSRRPSHCCSTHNPSRKVTLSPRQSLLLRTPPAVRHQPSPPSACAWSPQCRRTILSSTTMS